MKNRKKKLRLSTLVLLICIPVFCVSAYMVFSQLFVDYRQNQTFGSLIEQVNQARNNPDMQVQTSSDTSASAPGIAGASAQEGSDARETQPIASDEALPMLSAYAPLYAQNPDLFGWIEIADTVVNYPVMHTPEDPEFYLHRAYDGTSAYSGVPFLGGDCFLGCGNYIVYGHNMKNGTQFATIPKYSSEAFWREHPTIRFDTLYETGLYDVVAAFYSQAYSANAVGVFRYYQFTDLRDEERFEEYAAQVKKASLYDTGIELEYGDQLLTLSTCEYHRTNGRFVVVAKKC